MPSSRGRGLNNANANIAGSSTMSRLRRALGRSGAILPLLSLLLLVNLAASLYSLPLNRVIERRLCRDYYASHDPAVVNPDGSVDEELCKLDAIQQDLAWLQGIMDTTWIVGDFVMTIPLGLLAERYGHRIILWLNLVPRTFMLLWAVFVGYVDQALPTRAFLVAPFFSILGGDCVFNSITYALAASMTEDFALRASYFAFMTSITYVVSLLGPSLAAATMTAMLWLPFWIGVFLLILASVMVSLLEDRGEAKRARRSFNGVNDPLLARSSTDYRSVDDDLVFEMRHDMPLLQQVLRRMGIMRTFLGSHRRNLTLLLFSMVLTSLGSADTKLLPQYISKRYHWKFSSAGYILSFKAVVNILLLTIIVPTLVRHLSARFPNRTQLNIVCAQTTLVFSILGAFLIAMSTHIWILLLALPTYALGSPLPVFTLSLLKAPSITPFPTASSSGPSAQTPSPTHDVTLFSAVMLIKTLGSLLGAPLMAALWVRAIAVGGMALGLPFFVSSATYVVAMWVIGSITVGDGDDAREG